MKYESEGALYRPTTTQEPTKPKEMWGHAAEEHPEHWSGAGTRDAAIAEGRAEYEGRDFFVIAGHEPEPGEFLPSVDWILEYAADAAGDECGDAAEDFPEVSDEGRAELDALLDAWAAKHIKCTFWIPEGEPERVLATERSEMCGGDRAERRSADAAEVDRPDRSGDSGEHLESQSPDTDESTDP